MSPSWGIELQCPCCMYTCYCYQPSVKLFSLFSIFCILRWDKDIFEIFTMRHKIVLWCFFICMFCAKRVRQMSSMIWKWVFISLKPVVFEWVIKCHEMIRCLILKTEINLSWAQLHFFYIKLFLTFKHLVLCCGQFCSQNEHFYLSK